MEASSLDSFLEIFLVPIIVIISIMVVFKIFTWPISIAKRKNLKNNEIVTVRILTWCGIISGGLTWLIAMFLALCYKKEKEQL